jgi:hypothetical protein
MYVKFKVALGLGLGLNPGLACNFYSRPPSAQNALKLMTINFTVFMLIVIYILSNPFVSHVMICVFGLTMAVLACIWNAIGIDIGWLFLVMALSSPPRLHNDNRFQPVIHFGK